MVRFQWIALAATLAMAPGSFADETTADGIAAQVGNDIVLVSEVIGRVAPMEARMRQQNAPAIEIAKLRAAGLEKLIESRLIDQIVERGELYATDEEVAKTVEGIAAENGLTVEQLRQSVVAQGLTLEEYHDEIKTGIEHQKVIRGVVAAKISVEDFEVRALYSERYSDQPQGGEIVHLRQILVTYGTVAPENKAAVCKSVHKAKKRIETGEAFEKVASEISEVAAAAGGDIGWLHSDSVASWMSSVVDPLGDGQMTDVIELPFGCSLLNYEDVKEELSLEIYQTRLEEEFREWMEQLRARTYIERKGHFADAAMLGSRSGYSSRPEEEDSRF
ncbi:MAG: SurA N-terminal domain-containing protein [Deltaproteobacteria bacterium]|nr:SurA N-terminal domain-containing protein [Deltaproteobacteria bacterium]